MCLAIPAQLVDCNEAEGRDRAGVIEFGKVRKSISLAFVPDARPGDYVLVHTGFAIQVIDQHEADRLLGYLREMGEELEDEWGPPVASSSPPTAT